jgi:hypothetical protein
VFEQGQQCLVQPALQLVVIARELRDLQRIGAPISPGTVQRSAAARMRR